MLFRSAIGVDKETELIYDIGFCDVENSILVEDEVKDLSTEQIVEYNFLEKLCLELAIRLCR